MAYIDKYGVEYSDDRKILVKCPEGKEGAYCIPEGVTTIGEKAFHWCSKLSYVQIPFSVSEIKKCAFSGCVRLKNIEVSPYNDNYSDVNGILFNKQKTKLIQCPPKSISSTYIVPSYVQEIGTEAFAACEKLRIIVLPNSITKVEENIFVNCMSLNTIIVPKGEIQRFAAMEELNFYCGILTEDDNQNILNITTTMLKNIFYGALSFLCITLAICAIVMTCRSKAVVTVKASTGSEEIIVNVNSSSVDKAIENAKEIKTTWDEKELGKHYHRY